MVLNGSDSINKVSGREHQDLLIGAHRPKNDLIRMT